MDAEFFGYRSGAFTGARPGGSKGYLREADGGVLFLDEIGDMPLSLQTKLLRALQEREIVPLGGGQPVPIDFMLICATNKDLWELVQAGSFRSDLYFRIAQYTIALPSLRSRADRAQLIDELWSSVGGRANGIALSPECRNELASYEWPGNFRQMVGCLRAMLALGEPGDVLTADALPPDVRRRGDDVDAKASMSESGTLSTLDAITITAMQEALAAAKGNVSRAARQLGVSRSTLYRRMQS